MKFKPKYYLILLLLASCSNNKEINNEGNNSIYNNLQLLLDQKEYFKLDEEVKSQKDHLTMQQRLYFQAYLENAFNRNEDAIKNIDSVLNDTNIHDSIKSKMTMLEGDSYFKTFQYAKNAYTDSMLLTRFRPYVDSSNLEYIENHLLISNALKMAPPQITDFDENTTIPWTKDKLRLIEIPVRSKGKFYNCIFDTRANISSITKTYADKLGLKILDVSYDESSGATGIKFKTGLGIADSLYIGKILVRNVIFQVMPDSILYIAPLKFSLNVIIGFPVIEQLKEIHIFDNGTILIPKNQTDKDLHNLALDHLDPVVSLRTDTDTLNFDLDLGADQSVFYVAYFNKYNSSIIQQGHKKISGFGGAGGVQKKETYVIPSVNLYLGGKKVTLDSVNILTQKIYDGELFYGNLGQDFTSGFKEFILNFGYMYIDGN